MDIPGLLILLFVGWLVGLLLLTAHTAWMLTHPPRRTLGYAVARNLPSTPAEVHLSHNGSDQALDFSEWLLRIDAGADLPIWDIRGLNAAGPILIITHGWSDSRVVMLARAAALAPHAARVILWDLPRHGDAERSSPAVPNAARARFTLGLREHLWLRSLIDTIRLGDPATPVVLYGYSLGAGLSIAAAADEPADSPRRIASVIAEAPYRVPITPARNVLRQAALPHRINLPLAMLLIGARLGQRSSWLQHEHAGGFDRRDLAARLAVPLLILHGSDDAICPIHDARAIAAAHDATLIELPGGGHLDLWTNPDHASTCNRHIAPFLARCMNATQRST